MTVHIEGVAPSLTPNLNKHYENLRNIQGTIANCKGVMLIVGGAPEDVDDDEMGGDDDTTDCTEEQISELRHVIITENRATCIKRM